jgi:hypothetical protein
MNAMHLQSPPAGPDRVPLPTITMGTVLARHADETNYISNCQEGWVGLGLTLRLDGDAAVGLYVSLTPDEARQHAAELLRIADKVDHGKGTQ